MKHPLHSICPYFAMFPEAFVAKQLLAYTKPGDQVFDPFCGRGTAIFESLLNDRNAAGTDVNPVAACIAGAKAEAPGLQAVMDRLQLLEEMFLDDESELQTPSEFFRACFHPYTLKQILFLRRQLAWQESPIDRFIAAVALGCLHGESHKSRNCLSNRMPRTISTKPNYSMRWWASRGMTPPLRETFQILEHVIAYRLSQPEVRLKGSVQLEDARRASEAFPALRQRVELIVTSPPYLDTTDFREDQWLRLWFLGGPERPISLSPSDDRHTSLAAYWQFLTEAWAGCSALMQTDSVIVIRLGGTRVPEETLFSGLWESLHKGFSTFQVEPIHAGMRTEIKNRQTNAFRPGTSARRFEYDFAFRL